MLDGHGQCRPLPSSPVPLHRVQVDLPVHCMLITTHQGSALIVLDDQESHYLLDTIALVLASAESHRDVALPAGMEPMLRQMFRSLANGRGHSRQTAAGND